MKPATDKHPPAELPSASENRGYTAHSDAVLQAEWQHINAGGQQAGSTEDCLALAFSGGGIRSASFGMGLMQALAANKKLALMDYLSTVSGGGFLGSALTWYLSGRGKDGTARFDCSEHFPFGRKGAGNKSDRSSTVSNLLNYLRLHGNYLMPGKGLGVLAFVATFLRVMAGSFAVYFALLTLCFALLLLVKGVLLALQPVFSANAGLTEALTVLGEHAFSTFFLPLCLLSALLFLWRSVYFSWESFKGVHAYATDVETQIRLGRFLRFGLATLLLGLLPIAVECVGDIASRLKVAAGSVSLGAVLGFLAHRQEMVSTKRLSPWLLTLAACLLLSGMLLGGYAVADQLVETLRAAYAGGQWDSRLLLGLLLPVTLWLAWRCNINLAGLNRMYRNRLMETYMQAPETVDHAVWAPASGANEALLKDMCQAPNHRPYHLINCNVVLTDSDNAGFRGRKGDSFVVSPLFCGSDATGWCRTEHYGVNPQDAGLTLATAMAISGAAANPNAGIAGRGPTTDKAVALVMSLLSLRLGFWARNPAGGSLSSTTPQFPAARPAGAVALPLGS